MLLFLYFVRSISLSHRRAFVECVNVITKVGYSLVRVYSPVFGRSHFEKDGLKLNRFIFHSLQMQIHVCPPTRFHLVQDADVVAEGI